ncbi:MAG: biopolymer transporter ExbD [Bacteroidales bacterium]|nr:biopolymer transporter ExbD [Bacteroidales bacterium]
MAEIIQEEKSKGGKRRPKKGNPHMDMTPMVDLMCLLLTFFMLTTAFSKPKVMDIVLPEKIKKNEKVDPPKIADSRTLNIIVGPEGRVFWYPGKADQEMPLQETDFSDAGIRKVLIDRNRALLDKIEQLKADVISGKLEIKQDSLQNAIKELKKDDDTGPIVLIKFSEKAKYKNFVDIIDEMSIVGIARYIVVDINYIEQTMLDTALKNKPSVAAAQK